MRRKFFNFAIAAFALTFGCTFTSCEEDEETVVSTNEKVVTLEDVELGANGYWDGSDLSGESKSEVSYGSTITNYYGAFTSNSVSFDNVYTKEWSSWSGFVCSSKTDMATAGFGNIFSVYANSGADNSKQFAVGGNNAKFHFAAGESKQIKSVMVNNGTYPYLTIAEGNDGAGFARKFAEGDYYSVTFTGLDANGAETGKVTYYLADFRDGKSFVCTQWSKVDLQALGKVNAITLTFDSTDKGDYGINTPTYVCLDNLIYE